MTAKTPCTHDIQIVAQLIDESADENLNWICNRMPFRMYYIRKTDDFENGVELLPYQ